MKRKQAFTTMKIWEETRQAAKVLAARLGISMTALFDLLVREKTQALDSTPDSKENQP